MTINLLKNIHLSMSLKDDIVSNLELFTLSLLPQTLHFVLPTSSLVLQTSYL